MNKFFSENISVQLFFLSLAVFLSRLPFLFAGFGAEEDSWLLAITAKNIAASGVYEMSRAPAHPLQELIYSLLYDNGLPARSAGGFAFATNLLSAISSVIAAIFFALSLRNLGFKHYLFASFAFAFTPIVFISSTYTIDYIMAMAFVMGSFYFLLKNNFWLAGCLLGIAIGFRITSAAMLLPFYILLFPISKNVKSVLILLFTTVLVGFFTYIPVFKTYGLSFFTFSDQFPYPTFPKVFYKATIGVFGTVGLITILFFTMILLARNFSSKEKIVVSKMPAKLFRASVAVIIIYIISYLRLPQKSAYLIPAIPFIILLFGYFLSNRAFKTFCMLMTLSSFFFSINLTDSLRGSTHSPLSTKVTIAGQEIFVDPLTGPVFSDYTKRLNKIAYTEQVFQKTRSEQRRIVLICGWWHNELLVRNWYLEQNQNIKLAFYINKPSIEKYISDGYKIFYLSEQNLYNDQYSQMQFTDSIAKPYM